PLPQRMRYTPARTRNIGLCALWSGSLLLGSVLDQLRKISYYSP
uniref:Uncharacterized protein n=1 Tax=Oryzias latipes TaxID=8090 RepID=A0A3P9KDV8_ORYLA